MCKKYKMLVISIIICTISLISYGADLNELQDQKQTIQTQIDEKNNELIDLNDELSENLKQLQKLDGNIQETEQKLEELNKEITQKENDINQTEKELELIRKKYKTQKELIDARLVAMYESENTSYLDVVLGSKSLADFISSYYLISELTAYDMDLLELVANQRNKIELQNEQISIQKQRLESEKRTQQLTQIALANTKLLRENYAQKLSAEELNLKNKIDEYNSQINQIESEIRNLAKTISLGEEYQGGEMKWPIYNHYTITSNYGMRTHPITGVYKLHTGVDISAPMGTNFTAIAKGIVVKAEYNSAYGKMVIIDHGGQVQTLYAHGSEIIAQVGQEVQAGDLILKVGSTGYSTGAHAHFEVRIKGETVNPLDYVSIPE